MATAFQQFDCPQPARGVTLEARVGAATWLIDLDHDALSALHDTEMSLGPMTIARIMENMKAKALSMRWYGGGRITLTAADLSRPAPDPVTMEDGTERMPTPWFQILDDRRGIRRSPKLKSVA